MRPNVLDPLFAPATTLTGVGPKIGQLFDKLLVDGERVREARVVDLLFHMPHGAIDRRANPGIARSQQGMLVTLHVRVDRHEPPPRGTRRPYKVFVQDDTGELALTFFNPRADWLTKQLPEGEMRWVSGTVEWFNGAPQMAHPDHILTDDGYQRMPAVEPVYGLTEGLSLKTVHKATAAALERLLPLDLPEWQDSAFVAGRGWPNFKGALAAVHRPETTAGIAPEAPALARLAYDELLANQLALALVRDTMKRAGATPRAATGLMAERLTLALPFALTGSQTRAIAEITEDLAKPLRMVRLVQGDVGAGKTLVALFSMAAVVEAGGQCALMAPTDLLARQHLASITPLCDAAGLRVAILTGREKGAGRQKTLDALAAGDIDILVGTHAIFQAGVEFKDLGLAVVDEQHRFGVHQRLALAQKGKGAHLLVMTATPIPRTLLMTYFGDVDVSRLTEKPAGRKPIDTRAISLDRLGEVVERIGAAIAQGQKVYWVCPLVEESEVTDLAAAAERAETLERIFGPVVGLLHGKMKGEDKDRAMRAFQAGETRVLVATTVIEVGVDVPDATVMLIEHAERFGLAQLHQLRGRVGRGDRPSTCLLLYRGPLGETAKARLDVMRQTNDGFVIAEKDLELRGGGEVLGTRQSGLPGFRIANLEWHTELMEIARDDARLVLARDPDLQDPRGQALRVLLYLFERDEAVRLIRAA
ncbi:MAG: ATP-dependent DNA helicase RecG [Hyphomicrobiaceae bacterium]|nr:ATP-dependent DNA helicase RecG [Hyphomicrobiaceae bacterium]